MDVIEVPQAWIDLAEADVISEDVVRFIVGTFNVQHNDTLTVTRDDMVEGFAVVSDAEPEKAEPEEEYGDPSVKPGKVEVTPTPVVDSGEEKEIK